MPRVIDLPLEEAQEHWKKLFAKVYWSVLGGLLGLLALRRIVFLCTPITKKASKWTRFIGLVQACETKYLHRPALLKVAGINLFGTLSVVEVGAVAALWGLNLAFLLAHAFQTSTFSPSDRPAWYVARRAGHLCFVNLPLLFALVGRNNVISFLTGIPYGSLNWAHRAVGRLEFAFALIHALTFTVLEIGNGQYIRAWERLWWRCGAAAVVFFSVCTVFSLPFIRYRYYECFLVTHVLGAALALAMLWYHREDDSLNLNWAYAAIAIWVFDRSTRLISTLVIHFAAPLLSGGSPGSSVASISELDGALVLRVPLSVRWTAGQHIFITFWSKEMWRRPWLIGRWHPFSLSNMPSKISSEDPEERRAAFEGRCIVRIKDGTTAWLASLVSQRTAQNKQAVVKCFVQGPFGVPAHGVWRASTLVLIAGGSGITHILAVLEAVAAKVREDRKGALRRVVLVWTVRNEAHIDWVERRLDELYADLGGVEFEATVYLSARAQNVVLPSLEQGSPSIVANNSFRQHEAEESGSDGRTSEKDRAASGVKVTQGRPPLQALISECSEESHGQVLVHVCGPRPLSDAVQVAAAAITEPLSVFRGRFNHLVVVHVEKFE